MRRPSVFPAVEPVTLAEARQQCRLPLDESSSEDARLLGYIAAARGMAEQETGCRLITQTWQHVLDGWPASGEIELPEAPVQTLGSIVYTNAAGQAVTVGAGAYRLDLRGARAIVRPAYDQSWPTDIRSDVATVTVTYVIGFGDKALDVPESIREWILAHVLAMWENRGAASTVKMEPLPYMGRLLDEWRVYA